MELLNFEGQSVLDSRDVAEMIGKRHSNLMRDIDKYVSDLTDSNLSSLKFFIQSTYTDKKGEVRKCYLLTKQGCEFVANKLTGKKGNQFTAQYVGLFNSMKQELQSRQPDSYMIDDPIKRAERWIEERKAYEKVLPKAKYYDSQMRNPGLMTTTEIAKDYGWSARTLNKELNKRHIIFKQGKHWVPYAKYADKGYTQYEPFDFQKSNGQHGIHNNLKWTQKGKKIIYDLLASDGIHPVTEQEALNSPSEAF